MIGVLCVDNEQEIVREFFELFKTPWEYFDSRRNYDVVISTRAQNPITDARLVILYSSDFVKYDHLKGLSIEKTNSRYLILWDGTCLPVYGKLSSVSGQGTPLILDQAKALAVAFSEPSGKVFRVGFDLFKEIAFLLTEGQPVENASIPAVEIHISLLRNWILSEGIVLVEIPPAPWGYQFFACLTHDVDFAGIRRHFLDHTMWGFIYRGLVGSLFTFVKGKTTLARLVKNWTAVIKLPMVYMGLIDDYWEHFDQYAEVDGGFGSTFFLIPYKNRAGDHLEGIDLPRRAAPYDIGDVRKQVKHLMSLGFEIGLHGIDAWHSSEKGVQERDRIFKVTGQKEIGVRMHWLYYDRHSPAVLEQAGFDYDATLGYNETIGFKNGTTQVFQPFGATRLLEIPLNIQDTSLFYPRRMSLTDADAHRLYSQLLDDVLKYRGVLTLSWHDRSLQPERLWGNFYVRLLQELKSCRARIGSARQVVDWFRLRRSITIEETGITGNKLNLKIRGEYTGSEPHMFFRLHLPRAIRKPGDVDEQHYLDIPWNGETHLEIPLNQGSN